ncbi:MAG: hypothetical protein NT007_05380 [Candidatus Kapabacteria bacterium]|nr:hypothetical protein [Candidatus Kapabacteria bacterium]
MKALYYSCYLIFLILISVSLLQGQAPQIVWSTFLGSTGYDALFRMELDKNDNPVICGYSPSNTYPITNGAYNKNLNGNLDAVISKISNDGSALIYSTFIGGSISESAYGLKLDAFDNIYLSGTTYSDDFPLSKFPYQKIYSGNGDAFLLSLNAKGNQLIFSTFIGGSGTDNYTGLILDKSDQPIITGITYSNDFPTTAGAYLSKYNDKNLKDSGDFFISKLSKDASSLIFSTYMGGANRDQITGIILDPDENFLFTAQTWSDNYPVTSKTYIKPVNAAVGAYSKLDSTGSKLIYSSYYCDNSWSSCFSPMLGELNNFYISGQTDISTFPLASGSYNNKYSGGLNDCYISSIKITDYQPIVSTFIGGNDQEGISSLDIDDNGNIVAAGWTMSYDFPITKNAISTMNKFSDNFFFLMTPNLTLLNYSTYIGGNSSEWACDVIYRNSAYYGLSQTASSNFPTTPGSFDITANGSLDAAIFCLSTNQTPRTSITTSVYGSFCPGSLISIAFTAKGTFNKGNVFTAQLSDANGKFNSPVPIGSINSTGSGKINGQIPTVSAAGKKYRIRIVSTDTAITGTDNGVDIEIYPSPKVNLGSTKRICVGESVHIGALPINGTPPFTYNWTPSSYLNDPSSPDPIAKPDKDITYFLSLRDSNGCSYIDSLKVTVSYLTSPTILTARYPRRCDYDSVIVGIGMTPGGIYKYYEWSDSSGKLLDTLIVFNPKKSGTYLLVVKDGSGCTSLPIPFVVDIERGIKSPVPQLNLGSERTICFGDSVLIGDTAMGGRMPYFYMWSTKYGISNDDIPFNYAHPDTTTTYTLNVVDGSGCISSSSVKVNVNHVTKPVLTENRYKRVCTSDSVIISTYNQYSNYFWYDSTGTQISSSIKDFPVTFGGKYFLKVVDKNGCSAFSDTINIIMNQSGSSSNLTAGPLTSSGEFTFDTLFYSDQNCRDLILNNHGFSDELIEDAYFYHNTAFSVPQSQFPLIVHREDSLKLNICVKSTLLGIVVDTLEFKGACKLIVPFKVLITPQTKMGEGSCSLPLNFDIPESFYELGLMIMQVYPNPPNDVLNISFVAPVASENILSEFSIYNSYGEKENISANANLLIKERKSNYLTGIISLNTSGMSSGIYMIHSRSSSIYKFIKL